MILIESLSFSLFRSGPTHYALEDSSGSVFQFIDDERYS